MEAVGGELNAFTSKEETQIYSIFLEPYFDRACELLCDLVVNSRFPQNEIEKETDVIIDEINSYKDNPPEQIYDDFEELLFGAHPLAHNILGNEATLETFTTQTALDYIARYYRPENMIFFSMGQTKFERVVASLNRHFTPMPGQWTPQQRQAPTATAGGRVVRVSKDTHQAHVVVGSEAYGMHSSDRSTLALVTNLLGGPGMNSRLNVSLREKRGLVYQVEAVYTPYTDTGVFSIYFGTDPSRTDRCLDLIRRELRTLRTDGLTASALAAAKRQLCGQIGVSADNREATAMGMAKSFLHYGRFDSVEETAARVNAITQSDVLRVANEIFQDDKLLTLIYE
jgi:predicted Zn-dependent peptidase